ncbi:MAG: DUF177 domain-containing protein [Eubacteriales bacterium]|nr:DUF177 domain-containing protein [Eubacteriales bacterium]
MLLNLSDVLGEHHRTIEQNVEVEMEEFRIRSDSYKILSKDSVFLKIKHVKDRQLEITGKGKFEFEIPCDRCLEPVKTEVVLDFTKNVDLDVPDGEQTEEMDETNYIDGYELDVEQLICNEVLIGWPTKILCSVDCKGICNVCGQNLNQGACNCEDTSLDPRMSVIRDVFKNFKEV